MAKKYHDGKNANKKASPGPKGGVYSDSFAGMPNEVVMQEYPEGVYGGPEQYNDSREGIDMIAKDNHKKMMGNLGGRY